MKPKLILMSHGYMAKETRQSAKMIVGDILDAAVVSMTEEDGLSGTQEQLMTILEEIGQQPALVIADLKGGTPCNVATMAMSIKDNLRVISGLNLAIVLEAAMSPIEDIDELAGFLAATGKEAVTVIEIPELDDDEFEED